MDPAFGWVQPEQLGPACEFWYRLWEKEQNSFDHLNGSNTNMNSQMGHQHTSSTVNAQSPIESYIVLDENDELPDYAKGLKRKRDSTNKASTAMGMSKFRNRLIGKYEGCPWLVRGKRYSRGIIG